MGVLSGSVGEPWRAVAEPWRTVAEPWRQAEGRCPQDSFDNLENNMLKSIYIGHLGYNIANLSEGWSQSRGAGGGFVDAGVPYPYPEKVIRRRASGVG